jgi:hypothetical protein
MERHTQSQCRCVFLLEKILGAGSQTKFFVDLLIQFGPFRLQFRPACGGSRIRALHFDQNKREKKIQLLVDV